MEKDRPSKRTDKIKSAVVLEKVGEGRIMLELIKKRKINWLGPWFTKELPAEGYTRTGAFNPRPAGLLRPSGEFCAAREGYFTKYNAL